MTSHFLRKIIYFLSLTMIIACACSCNKNDSFNSRDTVKVGGSDDKDIAMAAVRVICRIINHDYLNEDIYAEPLESKGSLQNITMLCEGKVELAVANNIALDYALKGEGVFKHFDNIKDLRSVVGLLFEGFIFIVNSKSGIKSIDDIKGKKISLPEIGSAARLISDEILEYKNISSEEFGLYNYNIGDCIKKMETGELDGFMILTAQPNPYLYGITNSKNIKCKFISLDNGTIEHLQSRFPDIERYKIDKALYKYTNNINTVETIGSRDILITTKDYSKHLIYYITQDLCEDFGAFKNVNKSFAEVTPQVMAADLFIPVHPGAYKYYKKVKLAKYIPKKLRPNYK